MSSIGGTYQIALSVMWGVFCVSAGFAGEGRIGRLGEGALLSLDTNSC